MKPTFIYSVVVIALVALAVAKAPTTAAKQKPCDCPMPLLPPPVALTVTKALVANQTLKNTTIRVEANTNGAVYLWGTVHNTAQKTLAWRIAKQNAPDCPIVNLLQIQNKAKPTKYGQTNQLKQAV